MVGGWRDRQNLADRLDAMHPAVIVDKGDHRLNRRSNSACAKYALALRRISLAWRSSRFSRSRDFTLATISVVGPGRRSVSQAALFHPLVQRLSRAAGLACNRQDCRPSRRVLSLVIQHHSHSAIPDLRGELVLVLLGIAPAFQRLDPPTNPGRSRYSLMRFTSQGQSHCDGGRRSV